MELDDALAQVSEIRQQLAKAGTFRGYRALPAAFSSGVACLTAGVQPIVVPEPSHDPLGYVALWVVAAVVSVIVLAVEMVVRGRRSKSHLSQRQMFETAEQFLPAVIAGASLTFVLASRQPDVLWMLPGLWGMLFSLGVFAACRVLPRALFSVAFYYLGCGLTILAAVRGPAAFSPWTMAITFGGGQLLGAIVLYFSVERRDAQRSA